MVRITYVGHATVLIELGGVRLLTDPVLRRRVAHLRRLPPVPVVAPPDAVLLSHLHLDHLDLPSLRALGSDTRILAPVGAPEFLRRRGFGNAIELAVGQAADVGGVAVEAVDAEHDGRRRPFGARAEAIGFLAGGVYFAGDTDLHPAMADLAGRVDIALLPVWGWGTTLGPGHLDPRRAAEAAALIRPRVAIPIHWGTLFPTGLAGRHPKLLRDPPRTFEAHAAELAPDVEVLVLEPGESAEP